MVTVTKKAEPAAPGADSPDHVESLASIAALGADLDHQAGAPGAAVQAQDDKAAAAEIAAAAELLRAAAIPFAPEHTQPLLEQVWNDKQLERIAEAIVELCKFHGLTVGEFFSEYGPYLQLLAALGMPLLATLKILKLPPPPQANGQQQPA